MYSEGPQTGSAHPRQGDGRHLYASLSGPPDLGSGSSAAKIHRSAAREGPAPPAQVTARQQGRRAVLLALIAGYVDAYAFVKYQLYVSFMERQHHADRLSGRTGALRGGRTQSVPNPMLRERSVRRDRSCALQLPSSVSGDPGGSGDHAGPGRYRWSPPIASRLGQRYVPQFGYGHDEYDNYPRG